MRRSQGRLAGGSIWFSRGRCPQINRSRSAGLRGGGNLLVASLHRTSLLAEELQVEGHRGPVIVPSRPVGLIDVGAVHQCTGVGLGQALISGSTARSVAGHTMGSGVQFFGVLGKNMARGPVDSVRGWSSAQAPRFTAWVRPAPLWRRVEGRSFTPIWAVRDVILWRRGARSVRYGQ